MNFRDDLLMFKIPQAKILYMIYHFFKSGQLNYTQKIKLKELVILNDPQIIDYFQQFEINEDTDKLLEDFKKLLEEEKPKDNKLAKRETKSKTKKENIDLKNLKIQTDKNFLKQSAADDKKNNSKQPSCNVEDVRLINLARISIWQCTEKEKKKKSTKKGSRACGGCRAKLLC